MKRSGFTKRGSPLRRVKMKATGKGTVKNIAANRVIDEAARMRTEGWCELCGSWSFTARSHDAKRRHLPEGGLEKATILCQLDHDFIEYKLTPDDQFAVNVFIRENYDMEGEYKFEQVCKLIAPEQAEMWREIIEKRRAK